MLKIFRKKGRKGFTLVEVMIIIGVIIVGAILIVPKYSFYRIRAYDRQAMEELKSYYTVCQAYLADKPTLQNACTLAQVSDKFVKSPQIDIVPAGDSTCRGTTSQYSASDTQIFTIQRGGDITPHL
jgi:type II secretory pathway pseudopilin PulG